MNYKIKTVAIVLGVLFVAIAANVMAVGYWALQGWKNPGPLVSAKTIIIAPGSGLSNIAAQLEQDGVIHHRLIFMGGAWILGLEKKLKPGEYEFAAAEPSQQVLQKIASGKTVLRRVTIIEGKTSKDIFAQIQSMPDLTGDLPPIAQEGTLLPETYSYSLGDSRRNLIDQMVQAMNKLRQEVWDKRQQGLPFADWAQAVTVASIVEAETPIDAERPRVAAVYINRLRRNMPLQADPTVTYAMQILGKDLTKGLTYDHLKTPHPYNTYTVPGLPPGPIGNPGKKSIESVLHPLSTDELYFVADGKGGHVFSRTLAEHEKNVKNWRRINR